MAFPLASPYPKEAKVLHGKPSTGFTDLPSELLEIIYHQLDSIDDVHSLSRTHSTAYRAIEQRTVYTKVMRSIIGRSWQHRFDLQLCSVLELHREIVGHFEQGGQPLPVSAKYDLYNDWEKKLMNVTRVSECEYGPCAVCIPDTAIYDILARYQGLRVLETMWLKRQLEEVDILTADATTQDEQFLRRYSDLLGRVYDFESGDIPARTPTEPVTLHYTELNRDQRGRFYSVIVFVWILNELRWALANFDHRPRHCSLVRILQRCRRNLTDRRHEPVLDQLDQHAAFTFMYHHLLPKHSPALQDQNSSKLPLTSSSASLVDETHRAR
jgi:hypothetical protein